MTDYTIAHGQVFIISTSGPEERLERAEEHLGEDTRDEGDSLAVGANTQVATGHREPLLTAEGSAKQLQTIRIVRACALAVENVQQSQLDNCRAEIRSHQRAPLENADEEAQRQLVALRTAAGQGNARLSLGSVLIWDIVAIQIWDIDLVKNEETIREVLAIAQGEKALEEYLRQITEVWKNYVLELTNYQNKSKIIKGWDDLFNKVKEHINNVTSMKASPYFKVGFPFKS